MYNRLMSEIISQKIGKGKAIILIGARQVGKTTLLHQLFDNKPNVLWLNADEIGVRMLFENISAERIRTLFGDAQTIVIDEAQRIENVGLKMKLMTDNFPELQLVLTGSSSFDLANKINEPLTGRKWEYQLFPLSFKELSAKNGVFGEVQFLPIRLIYGSYPDVVCNQGNEFEILQQLTNSYLFKDILEWERIKKPEKLVKLLQALAFQIGSEVNLSELGRLVEMDKMTVEKYIYLLEQTQVIFRLPSLSRNLRSELKMSKKIYFYDLGIRNALINNFSPIENRADKGAIWENYFISERQKCNHYNLNFCNKYFWRTIQQQKVDYIEEKNGVITAYECKWNPNKSARLSKTFSQAYPNSELKIVNKENYYEFL